MADPIFTRNALDGTDPSVKRQAEAKPYEFGPYDRAMHGLTDILYGDNATPQNLDSTKRGVNAAIAMYPGATAILNRIPKDHFAPAALGLGLSGPLVRWIFNKLGDAQNYYGDHAFAQSTVEPIVSAADPRRQYQPTERASDNLTIDTSGQGLPKGQYVPLTREQYNMGAFGPDDAYDIEGMLPGPRGSKPYKP